MSQESAKLLIEGLKEDHPAMQANKKFKEMETMPDEKGEKKYLAGVIGVGAGGGNVAHLLTGHNYYTVALNTTMADMQGISVNAKFAISGINGSGKDRNFSASEFKGYYKSFFADNKVKKVLDNNKIYVIGTGGGGTGTIVSIMTAGYLKREYPDKSVFLVGLMGSIKEDLVSQRNMREFMSDIENKAQGCPYMLFDNNRVKNKVGDELYAAVNNDAVDAIRLLTEEFFIENSRSNIDGRDYARLTSFSGLMSVIPIKNLGVSVANESIDLNEKLHEAMATSSAIVTKNPEAYGFFMNTQSDLYNVVDTTFDDIQTTIGRPTAGLTFKHLQNKTGYGPEFAVIMTGMEAPLERFNLLEKRIEEYETTVQKAKLPSVDRHGSTLRLAGDGVSNKDGGGSDFMDEW